MSVHPPQQFSPGQILDAAHRAEAEGRADFALQFLRHLLDNYPGLPEAEIARENLARLTRRDMANPVHFGAAHRVPDEPVRSARTNEPHLQRPGPKASTSQSATRPPIQIAPLPDIERLGRLGRHDGGHPMPPPHRDYRSGRLIARLATWSGAALALAGLVIAPVALALPELLQLVPAVGPSIAGFGAGIGPCMLIVGLALVVLGQLARATLEAANATRDIAAAVRHEPAGSTSGTDHRHDGHSRNHQRRQARARDGHGRAGTPRE